MGGCRTKGNFLIHIIMPNFVMLIPSMMIPRHQSRSWKNHICFFEGSQSKAERSTKKTKKKSRTCCAKTLFVSEKNY